MLDSILLRIAKSSILKAFHSDYSFDKHKVINDYPYLRKKGAAFVTLKYDDNLRGCIGSIVPHRTLYEDIANNALSAGFRDPRFESLQEGEFSKLTLEVSVLSEPEVLEYEDFDDLCEKVRPNVDGLILKHPMHQGTFLPQVWEQIPTPRLFLEHLSIKAGANMSIYKDHPTILRYTVEAIEDDFDAILQL